MTYRRLISALLTLVLVFGAAGAITAGATLISPAPKAVGSTSVAKGPLYNGKTLARAALALQGSAGLVGRDEPEAGPPAPALNSPPASPISPPDTAPEPEKAAKPAPVPTSPPAAREERPQQNPAPAPRAKERNTTDKPVIAHNGRLDPKLPLA
jgi:outer membrane biosynthesis protein TonB